MLRLSSVGAILLGALPASAQNPPAAFQHTVTQGASSHLVDFRQHSARGPNFAVEVQQGDGTFVTHAPGPVRTYIGTIAALPGAMVSGLLRADGSVYYHVLFEDGAEWVNNGGSTSSSVPNWTPNYPSFVMGSGGAGSNVWAAEIGVDLPYSQYQVDNDVAAALEMVEHSVNTVNLLYLRDASILNWLGRVVIRADAGQDPYAGMTTTSELLGEIGNQWDNVLPPSTHDAGLVATSATGGGLANVAVIGNPGYSSNGASPEGDFTGVWRHEVGHNWSSLHFEGGTPEGPSIMSGNALSRMSGSEQARIVGHRDARLAALDNLGPYAEPIPPHASLDRATFLPQGPAFTIDVLDNDHDANGEAFTIVSFDATSQLGGSVALSPGTGPGGRDELLYTPPPVASAQADLFTYRIADTAGREGLGNVITRITSDADLLTHLTWNEGSGTVANDSSEYLHHATLENGPTWIPGVVGGAVALDGVDDRVLTPAFHHPTDSFTMAGWVRRLGGQTPFAGIAMARSPGTTAGLNVMNGNRLQYHWEGILFNSGLELPNETWAFVALVVTPTAATVYMDPGSGMQSATNPVAHGVEPLDVGFRIGHDLSYFRGAVDDFRFWGRALTLSELTTAASGLTGAADPSPSHLASLNTSRLDLQWSSPSAATNHRVYFSSVYTDVRDGLAAADRGLTAGSTWTTPLLGNGSWFWRIDTSDGSSWVDGPVWAFTTVPGPVAAAVQTYGAGCLGSQALVPRISGVGLPKIGTSFSIAVADAAPSSSATLLLAGTGGEVPLSGCLLLVGAPMLAAPPVPTDGAGNGVLPLPIPAEPTLLGGRLFGQFLIVDTGGTLFGAGSLSDGLHVTIGL